MRSRNRSRKALRAALHDPALTITYAVGAARETGPPGDLGHEIVFAGRQLGWVTYGEVSERRPGLLRELLREAHLPLEVARARVEVREALAKTRASRARIVRAGYDERRRLERDLHDGAQQRLVAIGISLRIAQRHIARDDETYGLLERAVDELQDAVAELRHISQGLRPRGLDEGLPAALRSLVRGSPVPIALNVTADHVRDDVASTACYVAAEAVANALKHARPSRLEIDLTLVLTTTLSCAS